MAKCRDCKFMEENYITALNGQGLFRFAYCQRLVHDCRVVEPDIERECEWFKRGRPPSPFKKRGGLTKI